MREVIWSIGARWFAASDACSSLLPISCALARRGWRQVAGWPSAIARYSGIFPSWSGCGARSASNPTWPSLSPSCIILSSSLAASSHLPTNFSAWIVDLSNCSSGLYSIFPSKWVHVWGRLPLPAFPQPPSRYPIDSCKCLPITRFYHNPLLSAEAAATRIEALWEVPFPRWPHPHPPFSPCSPQFIVPPFSLSIDRCVTSDRGLASFTRWRL